MARLGRGQPNTPIVVRTPFSGPASFIRTASDTASASDAVTRIAARSRAVSDTAAATDTVARTVAESRTVSNTTLVTSYTASTAIIPNPERGFFQYTETHYNTDLSGYTALNSTTLATGRNTDKRALVFRYFVMERYLTLDTIESAYLTLVAADFAACRTAGVKIIPRFTYSTSGATGSPPYSADPPVARVLSHISQLASTINAAADVIDTLEVGFIGMWGEWYYSDNFGDQGTTTEKQWADRVSVLNALYDTLDSRIFLAVRYVGIKKKWLG